MKNNAMTISNTTDILKSEEVKEIRIFALGPEGTNISQAAYRWVEEEELQDKAKIILCETPEQEIERAMQIEEEGVIPIFALCAVYYDLCGVFFRNLENYTFLYHYYMKLDNMQLASKKYNKDTLPPNASIAVHPSPAVLLEETNYVIRKAFSNSAAARMCASDEADACITTETARQLYGLETIKEYGAPNMLFTFGTTKFGMSQIVPIAKK